MSHRITVLDGGMGRELERIGAPFRQPEWSALALMEGPEWVVQAHVNFIDAGSEVITTNSYALVPFHIGEERFKAKGRELAQLAGQLARQAADAAASPVRVAGSLPPLFGSYRPDLFDPAGAARIIDPLIAALHPFVDIWLAETLGSIAEVRCVEEALARGEALGQRRLPLWVSFTLDDDCVGTARSGESVADAVEAAIRSGAEVVLFNCSQAEAISTALGLAKVSSAGRVAIGGYANRFVSAHSSTGEANEQISALRTDLDPASYGEFVRSWIVAGATVVGGCCGMAPAHIAVIAGIAEESESEGS